MKKNPEGNMPDPGVVLRAAVMVHGTCQETRAMFMRRRAEGVSEEEHALMMATETRLGLLEAEARTLRKAYADLYDESTL